jgi:hypothetical protein
MRIMQPHQNDHMKVTRGKRFKPCSNCFERMLFKKITTANMMVKSYATRQTLPIHAQVADIIKLP